jgi:hypothetical protein
MKKSPSESWLFFLARCIQDLVRDANDKKYWAGVFAMTGSASLAVAFIDGNAVALYSGLCFCLYGLRLNRKR